MQMWVVTQFARTHVFETAPLLSDLSEVVSEFKKGSRMDGPRKHVTLIFLQSKKNKSHNYHSYNGIKTV